MPLTDAAVRNLKPREKPFKVSDFEGLFLFVKPTGSKLWHFKYRIDGNEKLLSIGIYPEVGLAMARARKNEARALLAAGKDPGEVKKDQQRQERARRGNTFEVLALEFIAKAAAEVSVDERVSSSSSTPLGVKMSRKPSATQSR